MTKLAEEARAFGWELAELMLEMLRNPTSPAEAEAIGLHAAEAIETRAVHQQGEGEIVRDWAESASWGFRDRMAIAREVAGVPGEPPTREKARKDARNPDRPAPRAEAGTTRAAEPSPLREGMEAALRLIGGRDKPSLARGEPAVAAPNSPPGKARSAKTKSKAKPAVKAAPKRRGKPSPVE